MYFSCQHPLMLELCSIVSLVTRLWAGQPRNSILIRVVIFRFFKMPWWIWSPPSLHSLATICSFPECKVARVEVDCSPPSSAEVKRAWRYNSTPPICLHSIHRNVFFYPLMLEILVAPVLKMLGILCAAAVVNMCLNDVCCFDNDKVTFCLQTLH
jgi:hypothetical protein